MSFRNGLKKIAKEIAARYKYMRGKKGILEEPHNELKQWKPDGSLGKVGRVAGLGGIDLTWFLFCLMKYAAKDTKNGLNVALLNNAIIDKWEGNKKNIKDKKDDSKFQKFFKNLQKSHPRAASRLQLWMVYTLMALGIGGGKVAYDNKDEIKKMYVEWMQGDDEESDAEVEKEIKAAKKNTFGAYKEKLQPITPWLIAQLIAAEGVRMEDGMHVPYKDGKGIWTIGYGSTCLKDGTRVTKDTPPITTEEAYDLALWHIEENETFFDLYCYSVADQSLTVRNTGEAFGLSSIVYNSGTKFIEESNDANRKERFALLKNEYDKYGDAIPDSVVAKLFQRYPIVNKAQFGKAWIDSHKPQDMAKAIGIYMQDGAGMHWRRWLEAGLITGDINPKDLLECPIGGMYEFYLYMGGGKGRHKKGKYALWEKTQDGLVPIKSTYTAFKQWLKNPQQLNKKTGTLIPIRRKKVKNFIPKDVLRKCMSGKCKIGAFAPRKQNAEKVNKQTYTIGFEESYKTAMKYYKSGDYVAAIDLLEKLSLKNHNNALLHNDLALMYNKTGNYQKAIEHVHIILYEINDKSQYGVAQYNAGVAYENLGDFERALKNYKLALSNGNAAAAKAIKRIEKKSSQKKSKTIAFNEGILKIQKKQTQNNIVYPFENEYRA